MVCKYDKNNIEKHQLKLDDLLEKSFNGVEKVSFNYMMSCVMCHYGVCACVYDIYT